MKKLDILKVAASLIVSVGVGAIVGNAVKSTTPVDVRKITKFCIGAGSAVLSAIAGDAASKYTEEKIDKAVDIVKSAIKEEEYDLPEEKET